MLILLRKVVLNQEQGCPPGDIRRYLKTCLVVTAGAGRERGWYLLGRGYARSLRNTLQQSTGQTPPKRTVRPHMSLVLGLRKPNWRTAALINFARNCVRLPRSRVWVTNQGMR